MSRKKNKKEIEFYKGEIEKIYEDIKTKKLNSEEYNADLLQLEYLLNQLEDRSRKKWTVKDNVLPYITGLGGLMVSIIGIYMTWQTAKLSYVSDEEMKMKKGDVFKISNDYKNYYRTK